MLKALDEGCGGTLIASNLSHHSSRRLKTAACFSSERIQRCHSDTSSSDSPLCRNRTIHSAAANSIASYSGVLIGSVMGPVDIGAAVKQRTHDIGAHHAFREAHLIGYHREIDTVKAIQDEGASTFGRQCSYQSCQVFNFLRACDHALGRS